MEWTVEMLLGEIAAILARLNDDRIEDAKYMLEQLTSEERLRKAVEELKEEDEDFYNDVRGIK